MAAIEIDDVWRLLHTSFHWSLLYPPKNIIRFLSFLIAKDIHFYCDEQEFNYILEEINCKTMTHWVIKIQNIINNDASKKKNDRLPVISGFHPRDNTRPSNSI